MVLRSAPCRDRRGVSHGRQQEVVAQEFRAEEVLRGESPRSAERELDGAYPSWCVASQCPGQKVFPQAKITVLRCNRDCIPLERV